MDQLFNKGFPDRYRIQSLLGRQIGRRTFLARDLQTGLTVVVKLLLFNPDFTWDDLKLFQLEAEVLKSIDHPAIPKYLDYFEVETKLWKGFALVQTYIEARSLQDWMQSGRTFSEEDIKAIAKELLGILDYLHNRQPPVVHRDIKPSNILLGDRSGHSPGQVYLIDFGSVPTAVPGGTPTIVGTYGYMPPEQFGGQTTPASDLYALGATLIYLATGQAPDKLPQLQMRIIFADLVNLSPHIIDWLKWMTEISVDLRLKSAKQALEALEQSNLRERSLAIASLQPQAIATKPIGSRVQVTKTREMLEILIPPPPGTLGCLAIVCLVLICGIIFGAWVSSVWFALCGIGIVFIFLLVGVISARKERLRITQSEISLSYEILGRTMLSTAPRQNIVKVEITPASSYVSCASHSHSHIPVPPQIKIWAGIVPFPLNTQSLTSPEIDWLAQELGSWLNLPITKGQ
jgi:serine/threonine protein kinase